MRGIIYKYTINQKHYIGKTLMQENKRINKHKYEALTKESNTPFAKAIRKYGWCNVLNSYEVLEEFYCDTKEQLQNILYEKETEYIMKYNSIIPNGYNVYKNGAEKLVQHYKNKNEMYKKISKSLKGKYLNNSNSRRVYCVETKTWYPSIAEAGRQLKIDPSGIQKVCTKTMSTTNGYRFTYNEKDIPQYKHFTQQILCVELNMTFNSVRDALEYFGFPYEKRGELKNAIKHGWCFNKYHWEKTGKTIPCYYKPVL